MRLSDYGVSRQKQLITIFAVANAQKQGVMGARLVLASRTTMFQELEQRQNAELLLTKQKQSAIIYHEPNRIYIRGAFC